MKLKYVLLYSLIAGMALSCKAEDEEPPEYSPLLSLLELNIVQGFQFNGNSFQSKCNSSPLLIQCTEIKTAEPEIYKNISQNTFLTLNLRDNVIHGRARMLIAHFDLNAQVFEFDFTGSSADDLSGKKILTLSPLNDLISQTNPDYRISLRRMQLEMDNTSMIGAMDLYLTKLNQTGFADAEYTVKTDKVL